MSVWYIASCDFSICRRGFHACYRTWWLREQSWGVICMAFARRINCWVICPVLIVMGKKPRMSSFHTIAFVFCFWWFSYWCEDQIILGHLSSDWVNISWASIYSVRSGWGGGSSWAWKYYSVSAVIVERSTDPHETQRGPCKNPLCLPSEV